MCNIIRFLPGQMIDEEKFSNCVWNNWHSYGLVVKDGSGGMDVTRVVPKSGENDPKEIFELLKSNMDKERILHVRHNTSGKTDLENCHPFDVLYIPGKKGRSPRTVLFMHNGTMTDYKSKMYDNGVAKDDNSGPSDTKNFVDQILIPYLQVDYGTGAGDLSNPFLQKLLSKFWPYGNRGILIANDQPSYFLGEWKEFGIGDILKVANTEYFDKVTRGPEYERRRLREEEERRKNVGSFEPRFSPTQMYSNLKDIDFNQKHDFFKLSESAVNILNDWEVYDREHSVSVGYLTRDELEQVYNDKMTCLVLMDWIFSDYAKLYKEHLEIQEKHKKASNMIAEIKTQEKKVG